MHALTYFITYPFLYIISRLPFQLFYILSDFVSFFMQHILKYRKNIIRKNLNLVFPKMSKKEKLIIEKKTYKHICDLFLEIIKSLGMSKNEMTKRFKFKNIEVIKEFENNINNYNTGSEFILASMEQNAYVKESEFLAREIQYQLSNSLKNKKLNRGIKQAGFQVLVGASMPNVLIEVGFLTNTTEAQNLSSKKYQDKIAQGIVNALIIYKNRYEQHIIE